MRAELLSLRICTACCCSTAPPTAARFSVADTTLGCAAAHVLCRPLRAWAQKLGVDEGVLLTRRGRDVLRLLLAGHSERSGAAELGIRQSSFHQVVVAVYRKLGVQSRGELAAKFVRSTAGASSHWRHRTLPVGQL